MNNNSIKKIVNGYQSIDKEKLQGNIYVIKYCGSAMINDDLKNSFVQDIIFLKGLGVNVIIIHGGGKEISEMSAKLNLPVRFINGQRYTDKATMEVVQMVLAGKINKDIVALINKHGGKAIGLCGIDGDLLKVKKYSEGKYELGYVGEITFVNVTLLNLFLENDFIPVIAPIGVDDERTRYNINADMAASAIARSLQADKLIFISDVGGIIVNGKLLADLDDQLAKSLIGKKIINNGMIPKIKSAFKSLESGVRKIHIIDGRVKHSIITELFDKKANGTELTLSQYSGSTTSNKQNPGK